MHIDHNAIIANENRWMEQRFSSIYNWQRLMRIVEKPSLGVLQEVLQCVDDSPFAGSDPMRIQPDMPWNGEVWIIHRGEDGPQPVLAITREMFIEQQTVDFGCFHDAMRDELLSGIDLFEDDIPF